MFPNDNELEIQLQAPDGTTITLLNNATDSANNGTGALGGITGANLGGLTASGQLLGMVYDDQAPILTGGGNVSIGRFSSLSGKLNNLIAGKSDTQLDGTWNLIITSYRNHGGTPPPPHFVSSWGLNFNSGFTAGLTPSSTVETIANTALPSGYEFPGSAYPTTTPTTSRGVGPSPAIASDNTLGAFSPHQGRIYVAYVGKSPADGSTDHIYTAYSDNGGLSWTKGARPQRLQRRRQQLRQLRPHRDAAVPGGRPDHRHPRRLVLRRRLRRRQRPRRHDDHRQQRRCRVLLPQQRRQHRLDGP